MGCNTGWKRFVPEELKPKVTRGQAIKRFRWSRLSFQYGRWYYKHQPAERVRTKTWWQWENS